MIKRKKRTLALLLAALTAAGCVIPAAAAPIGSGVTPTYDEAYYATLDYYGNLLEGSVVKSYALNGAGRLTDYGVYDEVVNLTDGTPATLSEGTAAFQFSQSPSHFYFEGKTKKPFQDLPWTVTLRYTLNGVPARAEELAGKQGVVEILLDIVPNPRAGSYARYNYTLEAMALFNEDDILSLEAPGAQVQLVGNLRTVLFMCLPGEERHFTIRVGSDDFSFNGMTILMVPATLAQLEEIAKLSQRKDDLEEDYEALSGSLDALLDAMNEIQDGLYASASGLDQLDGARGTISKGKGKLYGEAGVLRGDLSGIADLLEPAEQRLQVLSQTVTSAKGALNELTDTAVSLKDQLDSMEKALKGLEDGTGDVKRVICGLADMEDSLRRLRGALNNAKAPSASGIGSTGTLGKVTSLHSAYTETNEQAFMEKMLVLQGKSQAEIAQLKQLQAMTPEQIQAAVAAGQLDLQTVQAAQAGAQQLARLFAAKGSLDFTGFCEQVLLAQGSPAEEARSQAEQMNEAWQIYGQVNGIQSDLNSTLNSVTRPTADVVGELADLCDDVDDLVDLIDSAEDLSAALRQFNPKLSAILDSVDGLRNTLNEYEPTLQEGLSNMGSLSASAVAALRDTETLLADSEALMKVSGNQLDSGAKQALQGLSDTLRQTAKAMAATSDVRDAKATINAVIEDTWQEYTGDVNNILMMDAGAEAVSLTDSRNPAPSSVQILIRTQEIKTEEPAAEQLAAAVPAKTTFWQRVAQMFRDFWSAVTGIFH